MKQIKTPTLKLVLGALFLSLALILPLFTSQLKELGDTLLPMHLPVLLCGLICGPYCGLSVGLMAPLMRSLVFGMPPIYPNAIYMALELATYGLVIGLLYNKLFSKKTVIYLLISLVSAQIAGRIVWGISKAILLGVANKPFTLSMFFVGGFLDALPGIALQLILIPGILIIINRTKKSV